MGLFKKKDKRERKAFKDTKFANGLKKIGEKLPTFAGDILEIATSGNPIGASINLLKDKLDKHKDNPEIDKATVEQIDLIKLEIDRDRSEWEREAEMYRIEVGDRDSARNLQIAALGQDDRFSKRFIYYLATFIIISATAFGLLFFFVEVPEKNSRLVEMFADIYLFAGAIMIIQFFFGSSLGSKSKDERNSGKE